MTIQSEYLVGRLNATPEVNLFSYVKFKLVKQYLPTQSREPIEVLDIGCGLKSAKRALEKLGVNMNYFGVDYEAVFEPDAVFDLLNATQLPAQIPWEPRTVMMLDVLEHVHEDKDVLATTLERVSTMLPPDARVIVTIPQLYRLDKYKLSHLYYPEHKIRLRQEEWKALLETHFTIHHVHGLGFLSVMPYLPMAFKQYKSDNFLGKLFMHLRSKTFEKDWIKSADWWLTRKLGKNEFFNQYSNDVLFVLSPKAELCNR